MADSDLIALHSGAILTVHAPSACSGRTCCIHNPSDHHMMSWPQHWRSDRRLMERICPHGVGHPDPDDVDYRRSVGHDPAVGVHGCDGCCRRGLSVVTEDG